MSDDTALDTFLREYDEKAAEEKIKEGLRIGKELSLVRQLKKLRSEEPLDLVENFETGASEAAKPKRTAIGDTPGTRRAAIEIVMDAEPGRTWKLSDLRQALVARGWLGADDDEYHRLQVTASRMTQRKQLVRPTQGHYRLPYVGERSEEP